MREPAVDVPAAFADPHKKAVESREAQHSDNQKVAQEFMEKTLDEKFQEDSFHRALKDGTRLCRLINKLRPGTIPRISLRGLPFLQMENISNFLKAAKDLGIQSSDLFQTVDLYESKDMNMVTVTILSLARLAGTSVANKQKTKEVEGVDYITETTVMPTPVAASTPDVSAAVPRKLSLATSNTNAPVPASQVSPKRHSLSSANPTEQTSIKPQVVTESDDEDSFGHGVSRSSASGVGSAAPLARQPSTASSFARTGTTRGRPRGGSEDVSESRATSKKEKGSTVVLEKFDHKVVMDYQLGNCIGKGQFGAVYKSLHLETGQVTAIKRIQLMDQNLKEVDDLMQEVELLKSLSHPNIVHYEGFHREEGYLNIILEYVENGSLGGVLKTFGTMPERLVSNYTSQILEGLCYLHDKGVVHCDLKAANILNTKDGNIKLSDFGVSQQLNVLDQTTKAVAGTPNWMAPEIIELSGASTKSDIWSLGCTIIELLTGKPPYSDLNPMTALFRIVEDDGPPIPSTISSEPADFLSKCFQKNPDDRWSARQLASHPWVIKNNATKLRASPSQLQVNATSPTISRENSISVSAEPSIASTGTSPTTPAHHDSPTPKATSPLASPAFLASFPNSSGSVSNASLPPRAAGGPAAGGTISKAPASLSVAPFANTPPFASGAKGRPSTAPVHNSSPLKESTLAPRESTPDLTEASSPTGDKKKKKKGGCVIA